MGQEHSCPGHSARYPDRQYEPYDYRADFRPDFPPDYRPEYRPTRRTDSRKSDRSTESSGYRSGSSAYDCHSSSSKSDYYCTSLYKNDHYKDINKELYKPVKIKDKRYKLQLLDLEKDELKSARLKSYLSDAEKAQLKTNSAPKKAGIRNYTPKILSEDDQRKKAENWI